MISEIKMLKKRYIRKITYAIITTVTVTLLAGCSGSDANSNTADTLGANKKANTEVGSGDEDYSDYIRNAVNSVSKDIVEPPKETNTDKNIVVNQSPDSDIYVSASEQLPEDSGIVPSFGEDAEKSDEDSENPQEATEVGDNGEESGEGEENAENEGLTPNDFPVGTSCIYINGEIDSSYGSDIITALNKARVDLGYPPLTEKTGLDTCADRRTREISSYLAHMRPNGTPFYSLAPDYFKAEMLAIDGAKAEETIDAWIRDPNSRSLVFTTKFTSVGAACFKCNGLNCVVVALGY